MLMFLRVADQWPLLRKGLATGLYGLAVVTAGLALHAPVQAQQGELDSSLNEQIIQVPNKGKLFSTELETTLYKPQGDGPFPVVVINHGKAPGNPRYQARYRPMGAARFFLQRGYAVLVPMRQGFSKSTGNYIGGGCNVHSNGLVQAEDVRAVLDWAGTQPWADKSRILVLGQSHGGWTTLAFGTQPYPGVKGLVNFAGGLRQENCARWEQNLAAGAGDYGKTSKLPSLWFYGDNDSYFPQRVYRDMFAQYKAAGGNAELVAFGVFGGDSHRMFGARAGEPIWQPRVGQFMQSVGLPAEVVYPVYGRVQRMAVPPASGFAPLADADKVPFLNDKGREGYRTFLTKQVPRAFAISADGHWAWSEMGDDPAARALARCKSHTQNSTCHLYAVDDDVVWTAPK